VDRGRRKKLRAALRYDLERRGETNQFLADLIEEEPDAAAALGLSAEALVRPPEAEWPAWSGSARRAWETLRNDRHFGAMGGMGGIFYTALSRYAEDHGIAGDAFMTLHTFVTALDAEYLAFEAERAAADAKKREIQGGGP
jgi:hypothetical protein